MGLNIFFDVDYTLIGGEGSLRPYVREVFAGLREQGHIIYVWSGRGIRWEVVDQHDLRPYVAGCYWKPLYDHRKRLRAFGVPVTPDFCVDDHQEVVDAFGGVCVAPYTSPAFIEHDQEMQRVYEAILVHAQRLAAQESGT